MKRKPRRLSSSFAYRTLEPRQLLATIDWTSGVISSPTDVSTNGTLVFAINGSGTSGQSNIVNGVNFISSTRGNAGNLAQTQSPGAETISSTLGNDNSGSFTDGGIAGTLGDIIQGGWWGTTTGTSASVTLSGLTVGHEYEIQLFANDARSSRDDRWVSRLDNGEGGVGVDLQLNNQPSGGLAGDFGIGTFTADSSTQSFTISGLIDGNPSLGRVHVNAIQLRLVTQPDLLPGAVPLINEFSASNESVIDDDNGNASDWIEIFNAGQNAVNLVGYTLTDDPADPQKFVFSSRLLGGGDYLVVFAGDDLVPSLGTDIYTGFSLSAGGEYLGLFDPSGNLVSEFGTGGSDYPAQFSDVSYGYLNDGNFDQPSFFATPTPGAANVDAVDGVIDTLPTVSVERGFHETAFNVDIVSQEAGAVLVYTTDGSEPSLTNGIQVPAANAAAFAQTTLNISETTSLRTGSFLPGVFTRGTTTHSYIFLDDVLTQSLIDSNVTDQYSQQVLRDALLDLPTVSFNFDDEIGRFDPEQRTSIEWLAPDGSAGFQVDAGIEPFGGGFTDFAKRNFRVSFRSQYGTSRLEFPLFEGFDNGVTPAATSFDALDFRAGSHDRSQRGFGLSNRFVDETLLDAGHVSTHGRFVHVYLNGQYWGQYHLRERFNDDFLASYHGGDEEDYELINGNANQGANFGPGEVQSGSGVRWATVNDIVNNPGLSPSQRFAALQETVNLEQYIDWLLIFMAGQSENEFRAGASADGSVDFIFQLNDADGWLRDPIDGSGGQGGDKTDEEGPADILQVLLADGDPEFLTFYADRIQRMFFNDGPLSIGQSTARLQELIDQVQLSVILEEARWGGNGGTADPTSGSLSVAEFNSRAQDALNRVLPNIVQRNDGRLNIIERLRNRGVFPNVDAPEILVSGTPQYSGQISNNSVLSFSADSTVFYTLDGSDPRSPGGGFNPNVLTFNTGTTQSTLVGAGSVWNFEDSGLNLGTAWRNPSFNDSGWSSGLGDFGFGDDQNTIVDYGTNASQKHITTYFRHTFQVGSTDVQQLTFRLQRDDGAAVYLNGVEIVRNNLPGGTIAYDTLALGSISNAQESVWHEYSIDPGLLLAGNNTLAVEIHQATPGSSDLTFNAELLATSFSGGALPIVLDDSTQVNARTFVNGQFSALSTADLVVPASQSDLRISEIHFNPAAPTPAELAAGFLDNDDFEFIEIINPNDSGTINLEGIQLSDGVSFTFGNVDLAPGARAVIVEDTFAFRARYGDDIRVLGEWSGSLSNSGETIELIGSDLSEIMSVNYSDNAPWHFAADGHGFSLVLNDPVNTPTDELGKYYSWRASTELGGTPGSASGESLGVVINEVLANSDAGQLDTIELFNPTSAAINVGGWYLSDDGNDLFQFQIPLGTVISANGYLVFDEADFNTSPGTAGNFGLSSLGEQLFLSRALAGTNVALEDSVEFNATFTGDSIGRLPNGSGRLTRLASTSFGSANGDAEVGPLVISEINYHPEDPSSAALAIDPTLTDDDLEFIEIANPTPDAISLTNWRLRGEADFDFAVGTSLAAGEAIVVVSFDPTDVLNAAKLAAFRAHYNIPSSTNIVGGFEGGLSNSSGRISLQQPDTGNFALGVVPRVVVDEVVYDDLAPWADADGTGQVLERDDLAASGGFASSWIAAAATPGVFEDDFVLGDANLDGVVNFLDIAPFIQLLANNTFLDEADTNRDGVVSFLDIAPFIELLASR